MAQAKVTKFNFRTDDLGNKRPTVELAIEYPEASDLVTILEAGGKQLDLLLEAVAGVIYGAARTIVNDKEDITGDNFPYSDITWEAIANRPASERKGGGISKEDWQAFFTDYQTVMPSITGKSEEKVANAVKLFAAKLHPVKYAKPILVALKEQLALYTTHAPTAGEYTDQLEFLISKADSFIEAGAAALADNL